MTLHQPLLFNLEKNDPWCFCFKGKEINNNNNHDYSLINLYENSIFVDCKINIIDLNTQNIIYTIKAHNIILIKCQYFLSYSKFLDSLKDKIYNIVFDISHINYEIIKFFLRLLYYNDIKEIIKEDKQYLNKNLLCIHFLSLYFGNKDILLFCEGQISKLLNDSNWITIFEYCLDITKFPYEIYHGKENLFRYIIAWLRCYSNPDDQNFCQNILSQLPLIISNFHSYDILKTFVNPFNIKKQIEVSFFSRICYNCCNEFHIPGCYSIELNKFNGFFRINNLKEIFHIILIKDNFNHSNYHLYIKRSYSKLSFEEKIYDNNYIENKHDINKFDEYKTGPEEIQIKYIKLIQSNIIEQIENLKYGNDDDNNNNSTKYIIQLFMIKLQKNTTNLSPISITTTPFSINQNEIVKIGEITINQDTEFLQCSRCNFKGYVSLFGFKLIIS